MLNELVEIDAQQLEHEAEVLVEYEEVAHPDNVMPVVRISPGVQELQDANFNASLRDRGGVIARIQENNLESKAGLPDPISRGNYAQSDQKASQRKSQ